MSIAVRLEEKYTYKDYLSWPEDERWEIINGVPCDMSPAPGRTHQKILMNAAKMSFNTRGCRTGDAPVRL